MRFWLFFLLCSAIFFPACSDHPDSPAPLGVLIAKMGNTEAQIAVARQYSWCGQHKESLDFCSRLIKKGEVEGHLIAGENYYDMGQFEKAAHHYKLGVEKTQGEAEFWLANIFGRKLQEPDIDKYYYFINESAKQGKVYSWLILGKKSFFGESKVPKNLEISEK